MKYCFRVLVALLVLMMGTASAQDGRSAVQAAATAMGAANLKTIQISGAGWTTAVGQSFSLTDDWPRFEMPTYTKTIDYEARTSREEYTRRQGSYPPRGGGFQPLQGEPRTVALLSGTYAWNMDGTTVVPQPGKDLFLGGITISDLRQLDIVLTPHGFLKAAMAADRLNAVTQSYFAPAPNAGLTGDGRKATIVSIMVLGKYRVNGTINDRNEVELVTTWIPTPFYGDTMYEFWYTQYKDFGGIKFPTLVHVHAGDPALSVAHNSMEFKVTDVKANVAVPPIPVPDAVRKATVSPVRVTTQKVAEGVWLLGGGSHNSVAVEFKDFVTVIEAPQDEDRSLAVIDAVSKVAPNKVIRYVVNTHHHFDHSGGLRTYVAHGAIVVGTPANLELYRTVMFYPMPRTLQPDRLATFAPMFLGARRPIPMEPVQQQYVISDGVRTLELHPVVGNPHAVGMLMAYLPTEKILVHADLYSPPAPNAPPAPATPTMTSLLTNIRRLKLDVVQHVPIHGAPGTHENFLKSFPGGTQ
jgi:glyoxylase-like metal-dependent hydrolase (beta-lactamase superfamily II)